MVVRLHIPPALIIRGCINIFFSDMDKNYQEEHRDRINYSADARSL